MHGKMFADAKAASYTSAAAIARLSLRRSVPPKIIAVTSDAYPSSLLAREGRVIDSHPFGGSNAINNASQRHHRSTTTKTFRIVVKSYLVDVLNRLRCGFAEFKLVAHLL